MKGLSSGRTQTACQNQVVLTAAADRRTLSPQLGVLVGHLALVNLAETLRDALALVQLRKDRGHVAATARRGAGAGAGSGGGRRRRRSGSAGRGGRRRGWWRASSRCGCGTSGLERLWVRALRTRDVSGGGRKSECCRELTLGFQASPVVWCCMTYFRSSSSRLTKLRAHSICFGFL